MKTIYYGHSCFLAEVNGKKLLFDPFISFNEKAKDINITDVKPDYILISHGHFDHIADTVQIAKQSNAKVVCSWEIHEWLNKQGVTNTHPMNIGGKWNFDFGKVKCVLAVHSSGLPDGSYGGNPMGFVVYSQECTFYFAGDTSLTYDMKLIGEFDNINRAFLPLGGNFTMDVDDAIIAAEFVNCRNIVGMHFDTFPYIEINHREAEEKFKQKNINLTLPELGKTYEV
ncbi:MAG: metal-dependent hydrolase [Flavobacteriales bacterium]|nr:metal-dependent hydrolase [Flavobacteriales bacterium]